MPSQAAWGQNLETSQHGSLPLVRVLASASMLAIEIAGLAFFQFLSSNVPDDF